ncbi:kinase, pfkB family protein [Tritrichomonas foetus]|uniref:Kinase, pfkB family protein n=1 Tax=Tritrichomonas foetus TaxID=1144522 RepID=A0A1J4JNR9_9EUKA|nr:kinase, pfkB family protein [Tritrichomonas foetus]|eukprot:OHT00056.1 kinase, pfkB family protein [Tritrichomonas foetus]
MDVVCVGVMVADVLAPGVDRSIFDREMTRVPLKFSTGGDAFNQAINLSSMGYKVALCGKVGDDNIGNFLISEAKNKGIESEFIVRDHEHQTSVTIVLINENDDRNFIGTANGTNSFLKSEDINTKIFQNSKIVSIGSIYGSVSFTGDEVSKVLEIAKSNNCVTVSDMMHADRGSLEDASKALKFVDYFIPNLKEAQELTGKSDLNEISDIILGCGVKCVVIKMGEKGCFIKSNVLGNVCEIVDSFKVEKVVDTTGAGDAFVSGFIAGLLDGCNVVDSARRGNAAGSLAVQTVGANGSIQSLNDLLNILK